MSKYEERREVLADMQRIISGIGNRSGHIILLNDYQVANLKEAIWAIGYASVYGGSPLSVLNNGDWLGELFQMLPSVTYKPNEGAQTLADKSWRWAQSEDFYAWRDKFK